MRGEISAIRFPILASYPRIVCAASTRRGGVSEPPFDSLNMGFSTGDGVDRVRENRRRFLEALGIAPEEVVVGQQVHGAQVKRADLSERGRGALDPRTGIPEADGLLTTEPGIFLFSISADCPLIALVLPPDRGVVLAHCGWRGTALGMPGEAVRALQRSTGASPAEMVAAIGPSIASCCYEVGEEVIDRLPPAGRRSAWKAGGGAKYRLDLPLAIRTFLGEAGMDPEKIEASPLCSSCERERFFSHRRDKGRTGRIGMVLGIRRYLPAESPFGFPVGNSLSLNHP